MGDLGAEDDCYFYMSAVCLLIRLVVLLECYFKDTFFSYFSLVFFFFEK